MKIYRNILLLSLPLVLFQYGCKNKTSDSGHKSENENLISSSISIPMDENKAIDTTDVAKIEFESGDISFDTITEGEIVSKIFHFKNAGARPLLLYDVRASCGCTAVDFPKEFIAPGASGKLTVRFDSRGRTGYQNKSINVIGNTFPTRTLLSLQGFVKNN